MKKWKHINFEQRKIISSQISKKAKLVEIADLLELYPTSVSKEIKRNRIIDNNSKVSTNQICKKTDRFPFVCNACPQKYTNCPFIRYIYDPRVADKSAESFEPYVSQLLRTVSS